MNATQRGHPGNCLGKKLAEWLKGTGGSPSITWSTLTAALKKVDEMETIADDIEYHFGDSKVPKNLGDLIA